LAVIRFEKTASRLTAIFLPRCNATYLLSGANIQTKNETRAKRCQILSLFNTFGAMTKNERFKKALDWLYSEGLIVDQQELSSKTGINEATISRILNNKVRQPSPETIRKLVSTFRDIDPAYLRGESESVTVQKSHSAQQPQTPIDSSSAVNAALAAYAELTNRLKQEMADRLADKDTIIAEKQSRIESLERTIANLERTVADKDALIRARDSRILELERRIAKSNADDLSKYPFAIGAAEDQSRQQQTK
jgi:transcriptional regulator with XRE-family HTH domain